MPLRFSRRQDYAAPARYQIVVDGLVEEGMSEFLAGMQIESTDRSDGSSITTLTGLIADQAELAGVVNSIYELHLSILSIEVLPEQTKEVGSQGGRNGAS